MLCYYVFIVRCVGGIIKHRDLLNVYTSLYIHTYVYKYIVQTYKCCGKRHNNIIYPKIYEKISNVFFSIYVYLQQE